MWLYNRAGSLARSFRLTAKTICTSCAVAQLGLGQTSNQNFDANASTSKNPLAIEVEKNGEPPLSLEELLKTEIPELAKENTATRQSWSLLVESLSKNEFKEADVYTETLLTSKSILAPLRFEFCVVYKEVSTTDSSSQNGESPALVHTLRNNTTIDGLKIEKQALLMERPEVYKKIEDKNKAKATSALIGSLIGAGLGAGLGAAAGGGNAVAIGAGTGAALGAAGGYGYAAADSPEVRLQYIEKRLQEITFEISSLEVQQNQLRLQLTAEDKQKENDAYKSRMALKDRVIRLMDRFVSENEFQPSIAIANAFLKIRGMDADISLKCSEIFQEESRVAKIIKIALTLKREVSEILNKNSSSPKPWTAFSELQKKVQMVKNSVQDSKYLAILEKELYSLQEDLNTMMRVARKQRTDLVALAERDAEDAFPELEKYGVFYQDDPDFSTSWLRVKDLRQNQAEEKVRYYMNAVEEVLESEPEKAKLLLLGLLDKEVPPIQKVILEAKIAGAFKKLHNKEIALIREDVDEAHSFLTKYSLETGSELASIDLSTLRGQLDFDKASERQESLKSAGLNVDIPLLTASGGINAQDKQLNSSDSARAGAEIDKQNKLFSFANRLFVGIENVDRCLSLLEGASVRARQLKTDKNLDQNLSGRLDGLAKTIDISLDQLKSFKKDEINARKYSWAAISSGLCLTVLLGAGGLIKIARRKSK